MNDEIKEVGKASPEQIATWKAKHGDVFEVICDGHYGYLKKPDRKVLSFATTIGQNDPMKFNELVAENCWLGGSRELLTRDEYFFAIVDKMNALIVVKEAEIKKL